MEKKIAVIDPNLCDGSPFCPVRRTCPVQAVSQKNGMLGGTAVVDPAKCIGCGKCVMVCPHKAVKLV